MKASDAVNKQITAEKLCKLMGGGVMWNPRFDMSPFSCLQEYIL